MGKAEAQTKALIKRRNTILRILKSNTYERNFTWDTYVYKKDNLLQAAEEIIRLK